MPEETPPNVKIYERPARKGPPPLVLALILLALAAVGFFTFKALRPAAAPDTAAPSDRTGALRPPMQRTTPPPVVAMVFGDRGLTSRLV
jgi:hypothetical protein